MTDTKHTQQWSWNDDGHGEDCDPPEPGKRWISILDSEGEEIAVLINRTGEPTEQQCKQAELIVTSVNAHERMVTALELIAVMHAGQHTGGLAQAALAKARKDVTP